MIPGKKYKPEDLLLIAWRRRWFILVPFVIVTIGTVIGTRFVPDRYRSDALILVVPQRVPDSYVRSTVTTRVEDRLQSMKEMLNSRSRLERIVQDFNLYPEARANATMEDIVQRMRNDIQIDIVRGDVFKVSYVSDSPRTAMKVTERLGAIMIEENLQDRTVMAEGTNQFLESQLEEARRKLLDQEKKVEQYKLRYAGQLPSQQQSNLQVLQNSQMQLQAVSEAINRDRDQRLVLERLLADQTAPEAMNAPAAAVLQADASNPTAIVGLTAADRLENARQLLKSLELRYKPEHPDIVRMKRAIAELESKAEAEALNRPLSASAQPVSSADIARQNRIKEIQTSVANLDRQIAAKQAEEKRLHDVIGGYQARVEAVPTRETEMVELTRDYSTLQQTYLSLLSKSQEAKIAANLERRQGGEQFRLLDAANLPQRPFRPDRNRWNMMGAVAGLGIGLALVLLLEYRDTSLRNDEDVITTLALPVLALVPVMITQGERKRIRRRTIALSVSGALSVIVAAAVVAWKLRLYQ